MIPTVIKNLFILTSREQVLIFLLLGFLGLLKRKLEMKEAFSQKGVISPKKVLAFHMNEHTSF